MSKKLQIEAESPVPLADAEISALLLSAGSPGWHSDAACVDITFPATGRTMHLWDIVDALAPEVQQARARRCDRCEHWYGRHKDEITYRCPIRDQPTEPDYHCADFTPRSQPPETTP